MYNETKEEYVYVIAGATALDILDSLKEKAEAAKKELADYVAQFGVRITRLDGANNADIDYALADETKIPEGWSYETSRAGRYLSPDWNTAAGNKVLRGLTPILQKLNIHEEFNNLSHHLAPSSHFNNRRYSFEQVGDKVIIACPKQSEGDAIIPPDCAVISYLEYITLKEQAAPTPPPRTRIFKNKFTPDQGG